MTVDNPIHQNSLASSQVLWAIDFLHIQFNHISPTITMTITLQQAYPTRWDRPHDNITLTIKIYVKYLVCNYGSVRNFQLHTRLRYDAHFPLLRHGKNNKYQKIKYKGRRITSSQKINWEAHQNDFGPVSTSKK
jgi:hypothetical protein